MKLKDYTIMKNHTLLFIALLMTITYSMNAQSIDWDQIDGNNSAKIEGKLNGLNMGGYTYGRMSQQGSQVSILDECVQCINFDCSIFLDQETIVGKEINSVAPKELFLEKSKELRTSSLRFPGGTHSGWYHFYQYDDEGFYNAESPEIAKGYGMNLGETLHLPNPYSYCQEDTKLTIDSNYIQTFATYVEGLKQNQPEDYELSISYVSNILSHFKFPEIGLPLIGSCTSTCGRELSIQPMENYNCSEKFDLSYEGNESLFNNNPSVYRFELIYKETQDAIEYLMNRLQLDSDDVVFVELGNEYYNNDGLNSGYSFNKYGMSAPRYAKIAEIYSERLKCYFENKLTIKTAVVSKPGTSWQNTSNVLHHNFPGLSNLTDKDESGNGQTLNDVLDGVILHNYYTSNNCNEINDIEDRFDCIRESFSDYIFGPDGVNKDLENFKEEYPGKSIWLTEWNIVGGNMQKNIDYLNTAMHAAFVQEYMLNLYDFNVLNNNLIELAHHHRIGFDLPWSVIQLIDGENDVAIERAAAAPIKNLSDIQGSNPSYFHGNILQEYGSTYDRSKANVYAISKENIDGNIFEVELYYTNKTNDEISFALPVQLNDLPVLSITNAYNQGDYLFSYGPSNGTQGRNRYTNDNNILYDDDINNLGFGQLHNSLTFVETHTIENTETFTLNPNSTGVFKFKLDVPDVIFEIYDISDQVKLSPNPFQDNMTIDLSEDLEMNEIEIINQNGQSVLIKNKGLSINIINTSQLLPGIYWYKITTNKGVVFKKGVKL